MKDTVIDGLGKLSFRRKASADLREAAAAGKVDEFAAALRAGFERASKKLNRHFEQVPLLSVWASSVLLDDQPAVQTLVLDVAAAAGRKRKAKAALQNVVDAVARPGASEAIATPGLIVLMAEVLVRYASVLSDEQMAAVYCRLADAAETDWTPEQLPETPDAQDSVRALVAQAEVPFVLSLVLNDLQSAATLDKRGRQAASATLMDCTDTDGTLAAALGRCADDWLAPFVRIAAWAKAFRTDWAPEKTLSHFHDTVGYAARLITADGVVGRPCRTDLPRIEDDQTQHIIFHAARLAGFNKTSAVASVTSAAGKSRKQKKGPATVRCSDQSDWAEVALLRRGLTADSDVIAVNWDGEVPEVHLAALGSRLLGGSWQSEITVNGERHETAGEWICTCWFEDKEVAFAELEAGADDGIRHVRHVMLSLKQHFAVLTETVTGPDPDAAIEVRTSLPIAAGIEIEDNSVTRELFLLNRTSSCRAIPCWLADDRVHSAAGNLQLVDQQLVAVADSVGGVTMPLLLDWHPERQSAAADWNRLTVTEDRQTVGPRDAAGFRVRVGDLQLLSYRSLQPADDLRAVLGLHTANETVYGLVDRDGDIDPLVLVEAEA
ncbi:MAG: hypothetical protein Fues2KO_54610 [Fuerstiella sp.]